ncbi:ABC transporter substrate-binding protein [Pseudoalteromonas sp. S1612]|nr:ABC transporter substrate-binding protein [Pseudoalteromonas sp. S1612]
MCIYKFILLAFVLLFSQKIQAAEPKLVIYTESFPPYNFQDGTGQLVGINHDIVKDTCARAALECEFIMLPWKRAYHLVQSNPQSAIFSLAKTQEREPLFKWVGPLVSNQTYFYKLKTSKHIVMDDITQAKNYSLGIVRGDIYEMLVRRLGFVADKNLLLFSEADSFMRLFFKKRIDLIIGSDFTIGHQTEPFGYSRDDVVKLKQIHVDELKGNYIGFNKAASPVVVERFNQALKQLKAESEYKPYINRYVKN